jgi:hypothetical protein
MHGRATESRPISVAVARHAFRLVSTKARRNRVDASLGCVLRVSWGDRGASVCVPLVRSAAATSGIAPMSPVVPRATKATVSGHGNLPINIKPVKLATSPATNDHAAKVVSILASGAWNLLPSAIYQG